MQKTPEKQKNNASNKKKQKARTLHYLFNGTTPYFTCITELPSSNFMLGASFPTKAMTFYCVFQDADSAHYLGSHTLNFNVCTKLGIKKTQKRTKISKFKHKDIYLGVYILYC